MNLIAVFKWVWRGWFVGVSVIFTPIFLLITFFHPDMPYKSAFMIPLVPVIAALQGLIVGGIVIAGLKLWRPKDLG